MNQFTSFKQLDMQLAEAKGTAFKRFKKIESTLAEGIDYRWLSATENAAEIQQLKDAGTIYSNSVNVVLVSTQTANQILEK